MQDGLFGGTVMSIDRDAEAAPVNANGVQGATRQADEIDRVKASERLRYRCISPSRPAASMSTAASPPYCRACR
jgi:hypothetical protein